MCDCYCCDSEPAEIDVIYLVVKITSDIDNPDCETKENIKFYYRLLVRILERRAIFVEQCPARGVPKN